MMNSDAIGEVNLGRQVASGGARKDFDLSTQRSEPTRQLDHVHVHSASVTHTWLIQGGRVHRKHGNTLGSAANCRQGHVLSVPYAAKDYQFEPERGPNGPLPPRPPPPKSRKAGRTSRKYTKAATMPIKLMMPIGEELKKFHTLAIPKMMSQNAFVCFPAAGNNSPRRVTQSTKVNTLKTKVTRPSNPRKEFSASKTTITP